MIKNTICTMISGVMSENEGTVSKKPPTQRPYSPSKINWNTVRDSTSWVLEKRDTNTIWMAKRSAQSCVSASPIPMENDSPEVLTATNHMPITATTAAPTLHNDGRLCAIAHQANGTITQYVAVRKALIPGVVCCSPTVWAKNAEKSKKARTAPSPTIFHEKLLRTRLFKIISNSNPASRKRTPSKSAGGTTSTTFFMTTKLYPQIMVANTMSAL